MNGPCEFEENNFQSSMVIVGIVDKDGNQLRQHYPLPTTRPLTAPVGPVWEPRCYDNWNRAAMGGNLTQFNDGILTTT
ncbi:MAG: hypothetical protein R2793_07330 [Flavobacteriaceae bacterium]